MAPISRWSCWDSLPRLGEAPKRRSRRGRPRYGTTGLADGKVCSLRETIFVHSRPVEEAKCPSSLLSLDGTQVAIAHYWEEETWPDRRSRVNRQASMPM